MSYCVIKRLYNTQRDLNGYKVWSGKWLLLYPEQNVEILFDSWEELQVYFKKNIIKDT